VAVPLWVTGQVLTASDVNNWFVPLPAYKTGVTSRTSVTQVIDPDLQVTVAASAVYQVVGNINYQNASGSSAINWSFQIPSGASGAYGATYVQPGPVTAGWGNGWGNTVSGAASDNLSHGFTFTGTLIVSSTAGTFGLLWAPTTGSAGAVAVNTGSSLSLQRVG
jgi:hypothetical protein